MVAFAYETSEMSDSEAIMRLAIEAEKRGESEIALRLFAKAASEVAKGN